MGRRVEHNKWAAVVETIKAQKEGRIIGLEKEEEY
jgi:hypothetical protein